jgi:hypothetical protein
MTFRMQSQIFSKKWDFTTSDVVNFVFYVALAVCQVNHNGLGRAQAYLSS